MQLRALLLASFILAAAQCAFADTFTFTASGTNFAASGTLVGTKDPYNSTAFDIQSATATINGAAYTLYTPSGNTMTAQSANFPGTPNGGFSYNNVLYTTGFAVDNNGLLFAGAANHFNLYLVNGHYNATNDFDSTGVAITFAAVNTSTVTPEPSGIVLLGTGTLSLLGLAKRRLQA